MQPDVIIQVHSSSCELPLLLSDFNQIWFFDESLKTKFHANSYIGSRVVPCRQTDRQRALTKLKVGFHNFANAPKIIECTLNNKNRELKNQTKGRNSSVGIATRYGLDGPGIESRWGARFSAPVQTGPGAHPASYTMGTGSFLGVKRPGRGVDHPPPSSAKVEGRVELYIYSPSGSSWPVLGRTLRTRCRISDCWGLETK